MEPFVSVIVPAYNAEDTLSKTVEDILAQTYTDYELILVDDGSTDRTPAICDTFAAKDARIRVLHQKNGGMSNARNNGTKAAKGRYISYIDSDDRVDCRYLEYLVRALEETGAAFAAGQFDRAREAQGEFQPAGAFCVQRLSQQEALSAMGVGALPVGPWCKLGRKELYLHNAFWEGKIYEDLSSTYRILMQHEAVALVPLPLYHYVMRGGSITGRKTPTRQQCKDYYEAILSCWDGVVSKYPELKYDAAVLRARDSISLCLTIERCKEKDSELETMAHEAESWVKKHWIGVFGNRKAPLEFRLRLMLFGISPRLYQTVYYLGIRVKGKAIK